MKKISLCFLLIGFAILQVESSQYNDGRVPIKRYVRSHGHGHGHGPPIMYVDL